MMINQYKQYFFSKANTKGTVSVCVIARICAGYRHAVHLPNVNQLLI